MESRQSTTETFKQLTVLIQKELQENKDEIKKLSAQMTTIHMQLSKEINDFNLHRNDIMDSKEWKAKVIEVWSTSQMKEAKDEIYEQKTKWTISYGVFIAAQIIWVVILFFKDKIIK